MDAPFRIAAVSFLNSVPLIDALRRRSDVDLQVDVPSRLGQRLIARSPHQAAETVLLPVADLLGADGAQPMPLAGGIASDGPTLTVRVFSRVRPERITRLAGDTDSHTSVALARLLWARRFGRQIELMDFDAATMRPAMPAPSECTDENTPEAVLLIGDKVIAHPPAGYDHQIDLGELWKQTTGLPFVFAVWTARADVPADRLGRIESLLAESRDDGLARLSELARLHGPAHGWPVDLTETYFARHMQYVLTDAHRRGMEAFLSMARF